MLTARQSRIAWSFLVGATVCQALAAAWVFRPRDGWPAFLVRYTMQPPGTPLGWTLAVLVVALYVAYSASASPVIRRYAFRPASWREFAGLRLIAVPMAFVTGFFEEAFFRKYLMDIAAAHAAAAAAQILISALVFGALHAIWGVFGGQVRAALAVMVVTTLLGAMLAIVYVAGDRSIGACVFAHVAINLILEPWLIVTSATQSWRKASLPSMPA
jgi:membrane protease YdiL (CAAX protease family)